MVPHYELSARPGHVLSRADTDTARGVGATAIAAVVVGLLCACNTTGFVCEQSDQCGDSGTCEPIGYCSFPDDGCESGRRYGEHGGRFAGVCVQNEDIDETAEE